MVPQPNAIWLDIFGGTTNLGTLEYPTLNQNIANPLTINSLTFNSGAGRFPGGQSAPIRQRSQQFNYANSSSAQNIANNISAPGANSAIILTLAGSGTGIVTVGGIISAGGEPRLRHRKERH